MLYGKLFFATDLCHCYCFRTVGQSSGWFQSRLCILLCLWSLVISGWSIYRPRNRVGRLPIQTYILVKLRHLGTFFEPNQQELMREHGLGQDTSFPASFCDHPSLFHGYGSLAALWSQWRSYLNGIKVGNVWIIYIIYVVVFHGCCCVLQMELNAKRSVTPRCFVWQLKSSTGLQYDKFNMKNYASLSHSWKGK